MFKNQAGVSKLNEARSLVDKLNSEAMEQSALLAEKQAEADEALRLITTSMTVREFFFHLKIILKKI